MISQPIVIATDRAPPATSSGEPFAATVLYRRKQPQGQPATHATTLFGNVIHKEEKSMKRFCQSFAMLALGLGVSITALSSAVAGLSSNGSFEVGADPGRFRYVPAGAMVSDNWTVTKGSVDYIGSFWRAAEGNRSIDLNGLQAGEIEQSFATEVGTTYTVRFTLAGNPLSGPVVKTLQVTAGDTLRTYDFDTAGHSVGAMGWEEQEFVFTATAPTTVLTFTSLVPGNAGPAIDNVRVEAGEPTAETLGGTVTGLAATEVICTNETTGESVSITGVTTWDCTTAGLAVVAGDTVVMQIRGTATETGKEQPQIEFTYMPPYRSFENLRGRVLNVDPAKFKVAVYIKVGSLGWWTKPYWSLPLTPIQADLTWETDVTTGGVDNRFTQVVAYLVPNGYNPPLLGGQQSLPAELDQNAVAKVHTVRVP